MFIARVLFPCDDRNIRSSSKGLFRKPDWDIASGCYDQAGKHGMKREWGKKKEEEQGRLIIITRIATCFKLAKSYDQAVQAYMKASEAFFKADA